MTMIYKAVTGRVTIPGTDLAPGGRLRVTARPKSTDGVLTFADRATFGPRTVETDAAGNMPLGTAALKIPQGSSLGDALLWEITAEPIDKLSGLKKWVVAITSITADTTIQELAHPDVTMVTPTLATTVGENAAAAATSAAAAAGSATAAATSATNAATAKTAAEAARDAAATSQTAAAGSATSASTSASTATTKASEAATSATDAAASAGAASGAAASTDTVMAGRINDGASATRAALNVSIATVKAWARNPDQLIAGAVTRDANGAATSAPVIWPDGTPGTYTADTVSTAFPGAVDAYHITYGSPATKTFTQPAITRNSAGAATNVPAIVVS